MKPFDFGRNNVPVLVVGIQILRVHNLAGV